MRAHRLLSVSLLTTLVAVLVAASLTACNVEDSSPTLGGAIADADTSPSPSPDDAGGDRVPDATGGHGDTGGNAGGDAGSTGDDAGGGGTDIPCTDGSDCPSGICDPATSTCAAATCSDGVKNGDETDVDCGGSCAPCMPGKACLVEEDCGIDTIGDWGDCDNDASPCSDTGMQIRVVTARTCDNNVCVRTDTDESQPCSRNPEGNACAAPAYGPWTACDYAQVCAESGTKSREVTTYACAAGSCQATTSTENGTCNRSTDTAPCQGDCTGGSRGFGECSGGLCRPSFGAECLCDIDCAGGETCSPEGYCCAPGEPCLL